MLKIPVQSILIRNEIRNKLTYRGEESTKKQKYRNDCSQD